MLFKKIDCAIYYEHVSREWKSVSRLKIELERLGLSCVILPKHYNKYVNVLRFRPRLVILPYLYSRKNDQHLMYRGLYKDVLALNLHSEQIHDETTKAFQLPHDQYARDVFHTSWSESFAKLLIADGVRKENVFVTGSIRCDDLVKVAQDPRREGSILIPTSFSKTFVSDAYIKKLTSLAAMNKTMYIKKVRITREARDKFFRDIFVVAQDFPNTTFIFRPHPYVEVIDYRKKFLEVNQLNELPSNIRVERIGSIQDAISSSDKLLAWYTSAILDAHLLGVPSLVYEPIITPSYMKIPFLQHFSCTSDISDVRKFVKEGDIELSESATQYIRSVYGLTDGRAAERTALVVANILNHHCFMAAGRGLRFRKLLWMSWKSLVVDLPKNMLRKARVLHIFRPFYKGILDDYPQNIAIIRKKNGYKK